MAEDEGAEEMIFQERVELLDRWFQKYSIDNRVYCVPIDGEEEDRLTLQYNLLQRAFDGRLHFTPLTYPQRVLDCGYGTGDWVKAFAVHYPESQVTGLDIYPSDTASDHDCDNLDLEQCDFNDSAWLRGEHSQDHFDLINSRLVMPGLKETRWQSYIADLVRLLRRDGWLQMIEYNFTIEGIIHTGSSLHLWRDEYIRSMKSLNRNPEIGRGLATRMRRAGLVQVQTQMYQIPIGGYHTDPKWREIGELHLQSFEYGLESLALWPLTQPLQRRGAWSKGQIDTLVEGAKAEAQDLGRRLSMPLYIAWGRKP